MQIWRYASWLAGVPGALLFDGDEARTYQVTRAGFNCEPLPNDESVAIALATINALPDVALLRDRKKRDDMITHGYRVSRALLGNELADQLGFPQQATAGVVPYLRLRRRFEQASSPLSPRPSGIWRGQNFTFLLERSGIDDLSYRLPDHLKTENVTPW